MSVPVSGKASISSEKPEVLIRELMQVNGFSLNDSKTIYHLTLAEKLSHSFRILSIQFNTISIRFEIEDIRNDYKDRIWSARHDESLSRKERRQKVHELKAERTGEEACLATVIAHEDFPRRVLVVVLHDVLIAVVAVLIGVPESPIERSDGRSALSGGR